MALTACALAWSTAARAQEAPPNGPRDVNVRWDALTGATLIPAPGEKIENATIVLRDGVIVAVAPGAPAPRGARVWDYSGLTVYPGLIDAHVAVDAPEPDPASPGTHWHKRVKAQRSATEGDGAPADLRKSLRDMGFAAAFIAPKDGVFRGFGSLVTLGSPEEQPQGGGGGFAFFQQQNQSRQRDAGSPEGQRVIAPRVFEEVAFETGGFSGGAPTSHMGAIALIRQTLLDADWRAQSKAVYARDPSRFEPLKPSDALDALGPNGSDAVPLLFNTDNEYEDLWAAKIAREFGRPAALVGSGREYRRLRPIIEDGLAVILPLNFADEPKVASPADQESVTLSDLMDWEQSPTNPRRLIKAGATVAFTTDKLDKRSEFFPNLRKAIEFGLSKDAALAALTTTPAKLFGVSDRLGAVKPGYIASLIAVDGDLFDKSAKIRDVWVEGKRYEVTPAPGLDASGVWAARFGDNEPMDGTITIRKGNAIEIEVPAFEAKESAKSVKTFENRLSFLVPGEKFQSEGVFSLAAVVEGDKMFGTAVAPDGSSMPWSARRTGDAPKAGAAKADKDDANEADKSEPADKEDADSDEDKAETSDAADVPEILPTPFGAFGYLEQPRPEDVAVINATIWTAGPAGNIENGALVIRDGKIAYVGPMAGANIPAGIKVIDARGEHVTPGLIDAHSHSGIDTGLGGVNEVGETITAEVRVQDVINPGDIALYRELAGGLTGANQLHGSANPIGGQNSVIKLRWGVDRPEQMRIEGAPPGIKFALGENPKRVGNGRYPDTRMGVEAIIRDRFIAARDYMYEWDRYNSMSERERRLTMPPRRDLELDALAEVLRGERLVHSHSYRQDEILMLTRVARDFGFKIGTFQHVLEGYKVAEAIRDYAIGASTFSDWWAYKFEVIDAIPYNGAIMTEVGVPVTFNSDSSELARRLNTEAAKAVKYGGVPPAEAIKFVTYNAALQLGIDKRTGSLEAGKDADFVIWSGDPLSYFSKAMATYIDGAERFSIDKDKALRDRVRSERSRIIQKILRKKAKGGGGDGAGGDRTERMRQMMRSRRPSEAAAAHAASLDRTQSKGGAQ